MPTRISEIVARLRSYEQATPQVSRINLIDWKVGDRILIRLDEMDEYYLGTVIKVKRVHLTIRMDFENVLKLPIIAPEILGRTRYERINPKVFTLRQANKILEMEPSINRMPIYDVYPRSKVLVIISSKVGQDTKVYMIPSTNIVQDVRKKFDNRWFDKWYKLFNEMTARQIQWRYDIPLTENSDDAVPILYENIDRMDKDTIGSAFRELIKKYKQPASWGLWRPK